MNCAEPGSKRLVKSSNSGDENVRRVAIGLYKRNLHVRPLKHVVRQRKGVLMS